MGQTINDIKTLFNIELKSKNPNQGKLARFIKKASVLDIAEAEKMIGIVSNSESGRPKKPLSKFQEVSKSLLDYLGNAEIEKNEISKEARELKNVINSIDTKVESVAKSNSETSAETKGEIVKLKKDTKLRSILNKVMLKSNAEEREADQLENTFQRIIANSSSDGFERSWANYLWGGEDRTRLSKALDKVSEETIVSWTADTLSELSEKVQSSDIDIPSDEIVEILKPKVSALFLAINKIKQE